MLAGSSCAGFYAQRTADDGIVFGCGGLPYCFQPLPGHHAKLPAGLEDAYRVALTELFPGAPIDFTHIWSGSIGVTRDWTPSVSLDRQEGTGFVGGFAAQGLATSYLAGRSMAALLLERMTMSHSLSNGSTDSHGTGLPSH